MIQGRRNEQSNKREGRTTVTFPDFTLPTEVVDDVVRAFKQNGQYLQADFQESKSGYVGIWFPPTTEGAEDRQVFRQALRRYNKEHDGQHSVHYFLLTTDALATQRLSLNQVLELFCRQFTDIEANPTYGSTQIGQEIEIAVRYPLFIEFFRKTLRDNDISYRENETPKLSSPLNNLL